MTDISKSSEISVEEEMQKSYLDYAMSVIIGRALPDVRDGFSLGNPGPGGYGVIIIRDMKKEEVSGGHKYTTNNRMELTACIIGLNKIKQLKQVEKLVILYSDSKYLVNGISKGWANKWKENNWIGSNGKKIKNVDLWTRLLQLNKGMRIEFRWVKGHSGNPNNERCNKLANLAAKKYLTLKN